MPPPPDPRTRDQVLHAIELYGDGIPIKYACKQAGISWTRFWFYRAEHDDISRLFDLAKERHAFAVVDQASQIADTDNNAMRARNRVQVRQWIAARLAPKTFGDKLHVESTHVDLAAAIAEARARRDGLAPPPRPLAPAIEASYVDVSTALPAPATDSLSAAPAPERAPAPASQREGTIFD